MKGDGDAMNLGRMLTAVGIAAMASIFVVVVGSEVLKFTLEFVEAVR